MNVIYIAGIWVAICILAAILTRFILVKFAEHNGHSADTMPMKYHMFAIGAYFTIIYPSLFILYGVFH